MTSTTKETQAHEVDAYEHSKETRLNTIAVGSSAYYAQEKTETMHYDASNADTNIEADVDPNTTLGWSGRKRRRALTRQ